MSSDRWIEATLLIALCGGARSEPRIVPGLREALTEVAIDVHSDPATHRRDNPRAVATLLDTEPKLTTLAISDLLGLSRSSIAWITSPREDRSPPGPLQGALEWLRHFAAAPSVSMLEVKLEQIRKRQAERARADQLADHFAAGWE